MTRDNPLVSIVIPVYNGARYLGEAIDSALAQTYSPCEIIVINDGSTDNGATEAAARAYGSRIRYISKPNGGVASALNCGIKEMKGEYFSWLSHDDVYYPWKVASQMRAMRRAKRNIVLFSDYDIIDEHSRFIQREHLEHVRPSRFRIALIVRSPVNGCTCLIPRECFEKAGCFDETLKTTQDNDLWFRMAETFTFVHMRKRLIRSRVHAEQGSFLIVTHSDERNSYYTRCMQRLLESAAPGKRSKVFARLAAHLKIEGIQEHAITAIDLCRKNLPSSFFWSGIVARVLTAYVELFDRRYMWGTVMRVVSASIFRRKVNRHLALIARHAGQASPGNANNLEETQKSTILSPFTLLLFTKSYPYDLCMEQTFIESELQRLALEFGKVVVIPGSTEGNLYPAASSFLVETGLARELSGARRVGPILHTLFSPLFYKAVFSRPAVIRNVTAMKILIMYLYYSRMTSAWIEKYVSDNSIPVAQTVFYTFWLDFITYGIGLFKAKQNARPRLISRAHGIDLYEERHPAGIIPCRKEVLALVDRLFLASDKAQEYMAWNYPAFMAKCGVARIGTRDPGFVCSMSQDGIFRIVSCSAVIPIKRLHLLVEALDILGRAMPEKRFEWHHIGDGPQKSDIAEAAGRLTNAVKWFLHGHLPIDKIMAQYRDNPVDLFVTLSETEGGCPVSIKEAQSCGVPVLGTSVGGIPEIVSDDNGRLLPAHPGAREVAIAIGEFVRDPVMAREKRQRSLEDWKTHSNETALNNRFVEELNQVVCPE